MNREQAKIIGELSDDALNVVNKLHFIKNRKFIQAFGRGEQVLYYSREQDAFDFDGHPDFYLIKKSTQLINGIECPIHETEAPKLSAVCFIECVNHPAYALYYFWHGTNEDLRMLELGLVHLSEENAIKCCKARYGIKNDE